MNLFAHTIAKDAIDFLMSGDKPKAFEAWANDHRLKMMAVPVHLQMRTVKPLTDVGFNIFRLDHADILCLLGLKVFGENSAKHRLKPTLPREQLTCGPHRHKPTLLKKSNSAAEGLSFLKVMGR